MFIDFWGAGPNGGVDLRAVAESNLAAFHAGIDPLHERPLVYLQADADWLARGTPPEWIADMLATIARYPNCDYVLFTMEPVHWQQRMKAVANLNSEGGKIALEWLDHRPPAGLRVSSCKEYDTWITMIPQAPRDMRLRIGRRIRFTRELVEQDIDRTDGEVFDTHYWARQGDLGQIAGLAPPFGYLVLRDGDTMTFDAKQHEDFAVED